MRQSLQFSQPVVGYEGQGSTVSPELDGAIRILPDINVFPLKTPVFFIIFKQIKLLIVLRQRLTVTLQIAPGGFKIGESGL